MSSRRRVTTESGAVCGDLKLFMILPERFSSHSPVLLKSNKPPGPLFLPLGQLHSACHLAGQSSEPRRAPEECAKSCLFQRGATEPRELDHPRPPPFQKRPRPAAGINNPGTRHAFR